MKTLEYLLGKPDAPEFSLEDYPTRLKIAQDANVPDVEIDAFFIDAQLDDSGGRVKKFPSKGTLAWMGEETLSVRVNGVWYEFYIGRGDFAHMGSDAPPTRQLAKTEAP